MSNHRPQPRRAEGFMLPSTLRENDKKVTHVPTIGAPMLSAQGESAMQRLSGEHWHPEVHWLRVYPLQIGSPA